jgi:4-amino-4-deoxychorismate lyase
MFPLFETIKIKHQKVFLFDDHLARMKHSIKALSGRDLQIELNEKIILQAIKNDDLFKCRILYSEQEYQIEISTYEKRHIEKIVFINDDDISYPLKFTDKNCFFKHTKNLPATTEPIFIVEGFLTDSSYSNIALWNGNEWHTPKEPLFFGVRRNVLLNENLIVEKDISIKDMHQYQKISFINAMLDLEELEIEL